MSGKEEGFGIGEVAARTGLEPDTLRYFERQGILPAPRRDAAGRRQYVAADVDLIRMLVHLRETGMPLADIAQFTAADAEVIDPSRLRLELLTAHRRRVEDRRDALDRALEVITRKIADYTDQTTNSPEVLERPDTTIAYSVQGRDHCSSSSARRQGEAGSPLSRTSLRGSSPSSPMILAVSVPVA